MPQMFSFDGIKRAAIVANGAAISTPITVPRNCAAMTIYIPVQLTSASWKIQTLVPDDPETTQNWVDASYLDVATPATAKTLTGITLGAAGAGALTIFNNIFGGGTIRIVTVGNEAAQRVFYVLFHGFQN